MSYEPVNPKHYGFLYDLLKERPKNASIAHKIMPSFKDHVAFVSSHPYAEWFVIRWRRHMVGSVYLTRNNEFGMFIKKEFSGAGFARRAFAWMTKRHKGKRLISNVNPANKPIIGLLKSIGCRKIQEVYEHRS